MTRLPASNLISLFPAIMRGYLLHVSVRIPYLWLIIACASTADLVNAATTEAAVGRAMLQALANRDALPVARGSLWRFEGPESIDEGLISGPGGFGLGPHSGRTNELAIDPRDRKILYVTAASGGVWKTNNGDQSKPTWRSLSNNWPTQCATALAIDPTNGNRIYVGTGDYKRLDHIPPFSVGIMRSQDGGATWDNVGRELMRDYTVSRIVVDPQDSKILLATTGRGSRLPSGSIFRSTNAGSDWHPVLLAGGGLTTVPDANWDDLEAAPDGSFWASATQRKNLVVSSGDEPGLLYRSLDHGATWKSINIVTSTFDLTGSSRPEPSRPDLILIAPRATTSEVFVAVFQGTGVRIFVTDTGGLTWNEVTTGSVPTGDGAWAHAAFTATSGNLYVAGVLPFRGTRNASGGFDFNPLPGPLLHNDFQSAVPDPSENDAVYFTNDGGVYRHSAQTGTTRSLSGTLGIGQVYRMDVHPKNAALQAIGTQDLGTSISFFNNSTQSANPPRWALVQGGDGRSSVFSRGSSPLVYLANTTGGIVRFNNNVRTIFQVNEAPNGQGPLALTGNRLIYADKDFWQLQDPELKTGIIDPVTKKHPDWLSATFRIGGPQPADIQAMVAHPRDGNWLYAGSKEGELFYSDNGGALWHEIVQTGLPIGLPVWAISPAPANPREVLIAYGYEGTIRSGTNVFHAGDRLFRKLDVTQVDPWVGVHGQTATLPRAPMFAIIRHPSAPESRWYVAGDAGVYFTHDGGINWSNANAPLGLPNTLIRDLRLSGDNNTLYAGTFGRGIWSTDINPPPDAFGIRGTITQGGKPVSGATVVANGAGRIFKRLRNTFSNPVGTSDLLHKTASIEIAESAIITNGNAKLTLEIFPFQQTQKISVSLVTPAGLKLPMTVISGGTFSRTYSLADVEANKLRGKSTVGTWRFEIAGKSPSVVTGSVNLEFTNLVSIRTAANGEYSLEYLDRGPHTISLFDAGIPNRLVNLQSNLTGIDFQPPPVGVFTLQPNHVNLSPREHIVYTLLYTITDGRNWREISNLLMRFGGNQKTFMELNYDVGKNEFSLVKGSHKSRGFSPGSLKRLESSIGTVFLRGTSVSPSVPDASSVMVTFEVSFKPAVMGKSLSVELIARDQLGHKQWAEPAGSIYVEGNKRMP